MLKILIIKEISQNKTVCYGLMQHNSIPGNYNIAAKAYNILMDYNYT